MAEKVTDDGRRAGGGNAQLEDGRVQSQSARCPPVLLLPPPPPPPNIETHAHGAQAKQQRIAAAQKKNTGVAVEIAAAATAMSQTYKSATGYESSARTAVPLAEMHKRQKPGGRAKHGGESEQGKSFNAKEKRKRDLGQTSRRWISSTWGGAFSHRSPPAADAPTISVCTGEKSYVEEEKRMLRDYSAGAGQGFA